VHQKEIKKARKNMTIDFNMVKARLEKKRTALQKSLQQLTEAYPPPLESGEGSREIQDWGEAAVDINEMEDESSIRANQQELLTEVEDALRRLEKGTYGYCVTCKQPIPAKRLEILPWAARDRPCQEQAEKRKPEVPGEPALWEREFEFYA
jgi:RNA polymerase-binding transcription factor DksA